MAIAVILAVILILAVTIAVAAIPVATIVVAAALLFGANRLAFVTEIVVTVEIILRPTRLALILITTTLIRHHTEIMVGELEIIFGVHAVALALRIGRHVLVLLVQLSGIAARATVDTIAAVTRALAATLRALLLLPATATATVLTVIDQITVLVLKPKPAMLPGLSVQRSPSRGKTAQRVFSLEPVPAAGLQRLMTKGGQQPIQRLVLILRAPAVAIAGTPAISKKNIVPGMGRFKA